MSYIPQDLKYSPSHEWVRAETDGTYTVGITDYAQAQLGDVVFIELPKMHRALQAGDVVAVVESVKAAADVYAPVAGMIVAVNEQLLANPSLLNREPYASGWLFCLNVTDPTDVDALLSRDGYAAETGTH